MPQALEQSATAGVPLNAGIIDRHSPIPFYFQLSTYMERMIRSRQWKPGQLLPSEQEFCDTLGISRTVVRQAVASMENKHLVVKQNGKRSAVAVPEYEGGLLQSLRGFYEDTLASGQRPSARVLELRVRPASSVVAEALGLEEGEPVIELNRLRILDGEPEGVEVTYIPESLCPGLVHDDLSSHSLYNLLEHKYGLNMASGTRTVQAVSAEHSHATLLGVKTGSPILMLTGVGFLADGRRFEYFVARHRGDRGKFRVRVVRDKDAR